MGMLARTAIGINKTTRHGKQRKAEKTRKVKKQDKEAKEDKKEVENDGFLKITDPVSRFYVYTMRYHFRISILLGHLIN